MNVEKMQADLFQEALELEVFSCNGRITISSGPEPTPGGFGFTVCQAPQRPNCGARHGCPLFLRNVDQPTVEFESMITSEPQHGCHPFRNFVTRCANAKVEPDTPEWIVRFAGYEPEVIRAETLTNALFVGWWQTFMGQAAVPMSHLHDRRYTIRER